MMHLTRALTLVLLLIAGCAAVPASEATGPPAPGIFATATVDTAPPALVPIHETGAARFLEDYPDYDGRGVVVAIFDTGVDPGAPGLQVTTTGEPKIVDVVDATGAGDVDTRTVRTLDDEGTLVGLTGRTLRPDPDWTNPTGEYRIGVKAAYDLFPGGLVWRHRSERTDDFRTAQRAHLQNLHRELEAWDRAYPKPTEDQLEERTELATKIDQFESMLDGFQDPGPVFDCIVFHDGETWRAALDTDEDGDFADETTLTNFRHEREFGTFTDASQLNYVLNIYDDGDVLSVVADVGAHGTHVAGIVAAYFPDQPELNGVAPGAQIVAVKIGDNRLGSTSCGTGDTRGLVTVLENDCDLINMSYGGPSPLPDYGRIAELKRELVDEHGVIFVASAGNSGPALSTAGSPGATTTGIFGIGAAVSPEMMAAQYARFNPYQELQFTFSSRGPALDGDRAVTVSAPGAAIAPVPNWNLRKNTLMNGTSMSAPNATGCLALLLSGMKQEGREYTPHRIRRAIVNSARPIETMDPFGQGAGMIQTDAAWAELVGDAPFADTDLRFSHSVGGRSGGRGLYLREPFENDRVYEDRISVRPQWPEDTPDLDKINFEMHIALEATEDWITVPEYVHFNSGGGRFPFRVDPTGLPHGAHDADIIGYDQLNIERGPIFRVPVAVIRTMQVSESRDWTWRERISLTPGDVQRQFFEVPEGATWADITIRRLDDEPRRTMVLHALQLAEQQAFADGNLKRFIDFEASDEELRTIPVTGGGTVEISFTANWSTLGDGTFDVSVSFHGVTPTPSVVAIDASQPLTRVDVTAELRAETIAPSGQLNTARRTIGPREAMIRPLSATRDLLWDEVQIHEMIATFDLELESDVSVTIQPALHAVTGAEEEYQSMIWKVFDDNRRVAAVGVGRESAGRLSEGSYTVRLHVRHDDVDLLERISDMPLIVDMQMRNVSLSSYQSPADLGASRYGRRDLAVGDSYPVHIAAPKRSDLPKWVREGDVLLGTITYGDPNADLVGGGKRPGGYPVVMSVPPKIDVKRDHTPKAKKDRKEDDEPKPTAEEQLADAILDLKAERLGKLYGEDDAALFDALAAEILEARPDDLDVHRHMLKRADQGDIDSQEKLDAVLAAADALRALIDEQALAAYRGARPDPDAEDADELRETMDEHRDALIDAMHRVAKARLRFAEADPVEERIDAFEDAWKELGRWEDTGRDTYMEMRFDRERLHGRTASALEMINRRVKDEPLERDHYETRIELLEELGFTDLAEMERNWLLRRFPTYGDRDYPIF